MAVLHVEITTAERSVFSGDVQLVLAPGAEGQLGILPSHASLMTMLEPGELVLHREGEDLYMAVTGGFLEVAENRVTILADACERAEEIDEARALEAQRRAQERIKAHTPNVDLPRAVAALHRAETRLRIARRRGPGGRPQGSESESGT